MTDYLVSSLHLLATKYPDCGILMGADKIDMNLSPLLSCGLKLSQIVRQPTRGAKIVDVLVTNLSSQYKSPIIAPPILPDDPSFGVPSDHSVPISIPHTDRHVRPERTYRTIKVRPLPESKVRKFGEWIVSESWDAINEDDSASAVLY